MSGYPTSGKLAYENLPDLKAGKWETGKWKGAILPLTNLPEEGASTAVEDFLVAAADWYRKRLE